jgi:ribose transport system permease protein
MRARPYLFALCLCGFLLAVNVVADSSFGDPSNWPQELASLAPFAIVAMASTPAILSGRGGLDVSIGPLATVLSVVLVVWLLPNGITSAWLCVPILLALGTAVGAINGALVAIGRLQPVIATLCGLFVLSGLAEKIAGVPKVALPNWTGELAHSLGPVPGALVLMAAPVVIWTLLGRTPLLGALYGVGGDDVTCFTAGIDVARVRVFAYALGGLFAAIGAIAITALLQTANASLGLQYTLVALAAVSLGGTPLGGGRGGLFGSFLGASSIYLLQTLLSSLHVSVTWLQVVYGAMLAVGVIVGSQVTRPPSARAAN